MRTSIRRVGLTAIAVISACALTACGASEPVAEDSVTGGGEGVTEYPLVVDNCGQELTFDAVPQRVVSLDLGSISEAERQQYISEWSQPGAFAAMLEVPDTYVRELRDALGAMPW